MPIQSSFIIVHCSSQKVRSPFDLGSLLKEQMSPISSKFIDIEFESSNILFQNKKEGKQHKIKWLSNYKSNRYNQLLYQIYINKIKVIIKIASILQKQLGQNFRIINPIEEQMQQSILIAESIRTIEVFYYSSPNDIFINTVLLQLLNDKYIPQNITIKNTQISEPRHHNFGPAPFLCVNHSQIVKRHQLWDFITLVLNIDQSRKYQFLSVAYSTEEISEVSNLYSEYDQNPYFVFISPWKKYKRHHNLNDKKHWFRDNSLFCSSADDALNKEYFIYKINSLGSLLTQYQKQYATKPQYLNFYKILSFALIKHLKIVENTLYLVVSEVKALKEIEEEIQQRINDKIKQNGDKVPEQRPPARNVPFTNVHLKYLNENYEQRNRPQEPNVDFANEKEKLNQSIFKPIISTFLFALAMWAFK